MTFVIKSALMLPLLAAVAGCVPTPEKLETEPVQINTPKGVVTCQLYTPSRTTWDRAINWPVDRMTVKEADAYCKQEGARRISG